MKKILKTRATATTQIRGFLESNKRLIAAASLICFVFGLALSHLIEPGVHVQKVTLAEETPALEFIPVGPGPHPVALLAHGFASSKETLFRYGEALAAGGFICYSVDQPGHGASPGKYAFMDTVQTLEAIAREVGPVDVFAGHSMGGYTGGEAVRQGGMRPGLFIAIGSMPVLGDHAPPLLLLAGRFEEAFPPALLKTRTDARLVISPWSDHLLEAFDPVLVNAAVEAACVAVHKTPPAPPTAWRWRLIGAVLAMLAAGKLASCLTDLFPQLARFRGLLIGGFVAAAFMLTLSGRWLDATPHLRLQGIAMGVTFLLVMIAGRLRIPRWSFAALDVLVLVIAVCWFKASPSWAVIVLVICPLILAPALIAGTVIGWVAARRGSRLQGDIAMAIFVGCAAFQCLELPRTAPEEPKQHDIVNLDAKLLDACIGDYEMAPDNVLGTGTKVTIRRNGDHLVWQAFGGEALRGALDLYPESETNFFLKITGSQVTFVKNDKGEATAITHHMAGLPDSEGKKIPDFTNVVHTYLQKCIEAEKINAGVVVGMVDEHGSRIVRYGKLDNGKDQEVNGDTLFEIGSDTKTFTALLLQDMVQRGQMKLDDPGEKYLPASVKLPARNGKRITLRQLATHTSGLPVIPDNLDPKSADNPYADYTVEKLYAFLSGYKLTRDPGAKSEYSNLGMGLLGHVIALKAGTNYESLVGDRICRPLKMDSTRITLTPELKSRFAVGHGLSGETVPSWDIPVLSGAGAIRSTVNDLLKYVSANLGLTPSALTPVMKKTCENGLGWRSNSEQPGTKIICHGGGTGGSHSFVGFDPTRRRGVVVLFNGRRVIDVEALGVFLLKNEWWSGRQPTEIKLTNRVPKLIKRPEPIKLNTKLLDACVGRYEFPPNSALPNGIKVTIWREEDQLLWQERGQNAIPGAIRIYPQSETNFFTTLDASQITFIKNDHGEVTAIKLHSLELPDLEGKKLKDK